MLNSSIPLVADMNGRLSVSDQERLVSREVSGDTEKIVYLVPQLVELKDGKPVFRDVRASATIKKENGRIVSISRRSDLEQQAAARDAAMKKFGGQRYKLTKSTEVRFKPQGEKGCQVDQKILELTEDSQGKITDQLVTYDSSFCQKLKPTIDRIGSNNASECGTLLSAVESALAARRKELSSEGKKFSPGYVEAPNAPSNSLISSSSALMGCISEANGGYPMGGYGGYGYGGIGAIPNYSGFGRADGGAIAGTTGQGRADGGAIAGGPVPASAGKTQKGAR